jgi:putative transcriptional regulator
MDGFSAFAEAYALGVLDSEERAAFEVHQGACAACRTLVSEQRPTLRLLSRDAPNASPDSRLREQILDLAAAPAVPDDLASIPWQPLAPGVRFHVHREDPDRGVRGCLIWASPGARHGRHRHQGFENILVLQGRLRDERGEYGPGEICRSAPGSVHSEEVVAEEDCVCYVVYYGGLEMLE